jgi:hypothetical protein
LENPILPVLFYFENHKENGVWEILGDWENFGQGAFPLGTAWGVLTSTKKN